MAAFIKNGILSFIILLINLRFLLNSHLLYLLSECVSLFFMLPFYSVFNYIFSPKLSCHVAYDLYTESLGKFAAKFVNDIFREK